MSAAFEFQPFSRKQKKLMTWWMDSCPYNDKDTVIADGAIRSGKTVAMINGFTDWSLANFEDKNFILAGKSKGALTRNVINPMKKILTAKNIKFNHIRTIEEPRLEIGSNRYYLFGANDKSSKDQLQGLTAAGAYLDEAALFPKNFVEESIGRCSVEGSKHWWNCNPQGPYHFVKEEYIDKADEKEILRLQFKLDDNLTLSEKVKQRYERMFEGVFYQRNILGMWVLAEGLIYDCFNEDEHTLKEIPENFKEINVAIDYGTANPTTFVMIGRKGKELYIIDEYYYSGRENRTKTDSEFADDLEEFIDGRRVKQIIVDPSAKSFITEIQRRNKIPVVRKAQNDVLNGIRRVASLITQGQLFVHNRCDNVLKEFAAYSWDEKAQERGEDKPLKENDHAMDAIRYLIYTLYPPRGGNRVTKKPRGY